MASYEQLVADIQRWSWRSDPADADFTIAIPTLITLGHQRANRSLRLTSMMTRAVNQGDGTRFIPLPGAGTEPDYLEMRSLRITVESSKNDQLIQVTPEGLNIRAGSGRTASQYCVHREIEFDSEVGDGISIEMVYYTPFLEISSSNPSNWLLENAYDIYLYGSLAEAEPLLRNDERIAVWSERWKLGIDELMDAEKNSRRNRSEIRQMLDPQERLVP